MLEITGIDVFHGDLQAVWDVSLSIEGKGITTLIGSNGSGKSTVLSTIAGLLKPVKGSIAFDGVRIDTMPAHKIVETGIAMVPEGRRLFREMTVMDNLEMGAITKRARQKKNETMAWVLDVFPILKERARQRADTLSGGEQQMLAIGRSLMSQPRLLLVDELSLGLAPVVVQKISHILDEINKTRGIGIFLVEQNVVMALELADTGHIIENGCIVGSGKASELLVSDQVRQAYLGMGGE
ncbi:MAG: ABC transporter ATP-binding protein [Syntrophorhabdaceae bacterium]|nr:ABC transporter ATP-binding protein [Syntrophorhabdaceae bacterium]